MNLQEEIRRSIERHDTIDDTGSWTEVEQMFVKAHRRRGVARAAVGTMSMIVLVASVALATTRIGNKTPDGFVTPVKVSTFRYSARTVYSAPGEPEDTVTSKGAVNLRSGLRREVMPGQWETITTDEHIYLRVSGTDAWARAPLGLADTVAFGGADPYGLLDDPATYLDSLREVASEVRESGTEVVDGEQTTRYVVMLDADRVIERAAERDRPFLRTALAGADARRVQVWVSSSGIAKKVDLRLALTIGDTSGTLHRTYSLDDFGGSVSIAVPEHDSEVPSLIKALTVQECMVTSEMAEISPGSGSQGSSRTETKDC